MIENFDLLEPAQFLRVSRELTGQSTGRVGFEIMIWYPDAPTYQVTHQLEKTARRGIKAQAVIDWYTLMTTDFHNNLWSAPSARRARQEQTQIMIQSMRDAGVEVNLLNPPNLLQRLIPQLGRNHRKIGLVDNVGFVMGFNFTGYNFDCKDIAVVLTDATVVEKLAEVFDNISRVERDDYEIRCNGDTSLLFDCGKVGQSLILDRAAEMVKDAREYVRLINPFQPNGKLEDELVRAAKRGVDVEGIVTKPAWIRRTRWDIRLMQQLNRMGSRFLGCQLALGYHNPDIHAKVLVADNKALVGSHNFVWEGVWAGTKELDIFSINPTLVRNLNRYYTHLKIKA